MCELALEYGLLSDGHGHAPTTADLYITNQQKGLLVRPTPVQLRGCSSVLKSGKMMQVTKTEAPTPRSFCMGGTRRLAAGKV